MAEGSRRGGPESGKWGWWSQKDRKAGRGAAWAAWVEMLRRRGDAALLRSSECRCTAVDASERHGGVWGCTSVSLGEPRRGRGQDETSGSLSYFKLASSYHMVDLF
jgi:hypothetical protein